MYDLSLLEYHKILEYIKKYSIFEITKNRIDNLTPSNNKEDILKLLNETYDAKNCIYRNGTIEMYNYSLVNTIDRLRISSNLNITDFIEIYKLCLNSSYLKDGYFKDDQSNSKYIKNYIDELNDLSIVKKEIQRVMDIDGNIYDNASIELNDIRRKIKKAESDINNKLNDMLRTLSSKLSESIITIRNGHRVIPIKSDYKSQIKGIIYDESASGQTSYIEPFEIGELEAKINILKNDEKTEINKILSKLSNDIYKYYDVISLNDKIVCELDFIFSKGMYAKEIDAEIVNIDDNINLINSRHPLIDKDKIIKNTISLENKKGMIITGPNTGGKTVVLKTVGLLSCLAQSGILIPVDQGSSIKIFDNIFADIGDEQSIEQSLSTFSSHMSKIVNITNNINDKTLVLLDELGSGTDPKEGASLAISIINYLKEMNSTFICTTHYPELKMYAYNDLDVLNASVEFDTNSLKPTYKLLIGVSGKSNAFLISKRLGLKDSILKDAEKVDLEFKDSNSNLIQKLEEESLYLEKKKQEYEKLIQESKDIKLKLEEESKDIKNKLLKELDNTNTDRNKILLKTQDEATKLLDEIKQIKKSLLNEENVKDNIIADLRGKTNSLLVDKSINRFKREDEIKVNDYVRVVDLNQAGQVTKIKGDKYYVQIGSFLSSFNKDDLELVEVIDQVKLATKKNNTSFTYALSNRLDLRGKRYDEAKYELEKFIDEAIMSNLESVDIIHGYGTLSLMKMVTEFCKTHDVVKSYRPGEEHEGGRGVTVVKLK